MLDRLRRAAAVLLAGCALLGLAACGAARATTTGETVSTSPPIGEAPAGTGQATVLTRTYSDLPQSRTPEGYYVLGRADAPVLIQHYSDFL